MNYEKIYDSLMNRSKGRKKSRDVYYEKHHIIPKCLGGDNSKENLTLLTAEEHWVAHLLLVKINPGIPKLVYACQAMSMIGGNTGRTNNKMFGWIRREYATTVSKRMGGRTLSEETKEKISKSLKGRLPEHQKYGNISLRPEVAKKISDSKKGIPTGPFTTERKENIRKAKLGKPNSFMQNNNPNKIRVTCLGCKKETTLPAFNKAHSKH
jgi:hypothetical protein